MEEKYFLLLQAFFFSPFIFGVFFLLKCQNLQVWQAKELNSITKY